MGLGKEKKEEVASFYRFNDMNTQWSAKGGSPNWLGVRRWRKTCLHKALENTKSPEQLVEKMFYEEEAERGGIGND